MKLTTVQILEANEALAQLGALELPISTSVKVARLHKKVEAEAMPLMELRDALIRKHGKPSKDNPQMIQVPRSGKEAIEFAKEVSELLAQEIEVKDLPTLKLPTDGLNVKPAIIKALLDFIEEEKT